MTVSELSTISPIRPVSVYCIHVRDFSFSMLTTGLRGELLFLDQLTPWEAKKRMEDHKRWEQEHREELERDSQQLFDDMFGGWYH